MKLFYNSFKLTCSSVCRKFHVRQKCQSLVILLLLATVTGYLFVRFNMTSEENRLFPEKIANGTECGIWPDTGCNMGRSRASNQHRFIQRYARSSNGSVRSTKSILLIGEFYFDFGEAQRELVGCPISECTLTLDSNQYRRTVDAIVILNMDPQTLKKFLPKPAHQIWIANHWESPPHNRIDTAAVSNYINWSSSYRHDSHIVTPYGYVERRPSDIAQPTSGQKVENYAAGKTKQVAWFVSNCNDRNGRKAYADELSRYIGVDIYGKCGKLRCPINNSSVCLGLLQKNYKFYLAFENSNCQDYMTEKLFWNSLRYNVIPIVMGARPEDYAASLPPHSYIHVDDFRSPRDLADYLHVLDGNETMYSEYFRWKSDWVLTGYSYWCRVCGLLHIASEQNYVHWYRDYSRWWDSACGSRWTKHNGVRWQRWNSMN